jgi:hypothetical protein
MATSTVVQIGQTGARRNGTRELVGSLALVSLASGGVKVGALRGLCRLAGWEEDEPRLCLQAGGEGGVWMLVAPAYARAVEGLAPAPPAAVPAETAPGPAAAPAPGDRALVLLRNHLTYSGFFLGRVANPFHGGRGGVLLGFAPGAPLLYWFDDAEVRRLRATVPGALPEASAPLALQPQ